MLQISTHPPVRAQSNVYSPSVYTNAPKMWVCSVASEAYHDWSGEAASARLRVNFTLKLLLSQNFCNRPLMRFIRFASNIGPAAAVPAGPAPAPLVLCQKEICWKCCTRPARNVRGTNGMLMWRTLVCNFVVALGT